MTRRLGGATLVAVMVVGAWLQAAAPSGRSAVADAAMRREVDIVRTLLRQGADVNGAQGDGMTALHWAATHGDAALTEILLYGGANVKATSRLGRYTPLHVASQNGAAPVVAALLARGAEVNATTTTGATALMFAAQAGHVPTVTALLDAKADVNATEQANGQTALMFAATADRADVATLLLARGAKADVTSKVVDLAALTSNDGEGRAPEPQAGGQNQARPAAPPRPAPRLNDVAGATRPYRYNELIGAQGGLSALHFAARQGAFAAARAIVPVLREDYVAHALLDRAAMGLFVGAHAGQEQQFLPELRGGVTMPADQQIAQHGRVLEQFDVLERAGDAEAGDLVRRLLGDVLVIEEDLARRRRVDPRDQVEDRALAGAIGADDREDLALLHGEADRIDRLEAAEVQREIVCTEVAHRFRSDFT